MEKSSTSNREKSAVLSQTRKNRSKSIPLIYLHTTKKRKNAFISQLTIVGFYRGYKEVTRQKVLKRSYSYHTRDCVLIKNDPIDNEFDNNPLPDLRTPKTPPVVLLDSDTLNFSKQFSNILLEKFEEFNLLLENTNKTLENYDSDLFYQSSTSEKSPAKRLQATSTKIRNIPTENIKSSHNQPEIITDRTAKEYARVSLLLPETWNKKNLINTTTPLNDIFARTLAVGQGKLQSTAICQMCKTTGKSLTFCSNCHCPLSVISPLSKTQKYAFSPSRFDFVPANEFATPIRMEGLEYDVNPKSKALVLEQAESNVFYTLLLNPSIPEKFIQMYFLCFEIIFSPTKLFHDLRDLFFVDSKDGIDYSDRIISLFFAWTKYNLSSIKETAEIMSQLPEFLGHLSVKGDKFASFASKFQESLQELKEDEQSKYELDIFKKNVFPVLIDSKTFNQNKEKINIIKFHPIEVARQITILVKKLFNQIDRREFINRTFENDDPQYAPNIKKFSARMSKFTAWALTVLMTSETPKKRAKVIIFFVNLAEKLQDLQNHAAMFNIFAFLDSNETKRLQKTWKLVPHDIMKRIATIKDFLTPMGNFRNIRPIFERGSTPFIPLFPMVLRDLIFIEDGNDSWNNTSKTSINVMKLEMIGKNIGRIYESQTANYFFWPLPILQNYFETYEPLPLDHIEKLAKTLEPD